MIIAQKTIERVEGLAKKMVWTTLGRRLVKSLEEQVASARKLVVMVGIDNFKRNFLEEDWFPADVRCLLEQGMGKDDIKEHYWSCTAFRELWMSMGLKEGNLDRIINDAIIKYLTE